MVRGILETTSSCFAIRLGKYVIAKPRSMTRINPTLLSRILSILKSTWNRFDQILKPVPRRKAKSESIRLLESDRPFPTVALSSLLRVSLDQRAARSSSKTNSFYHRCCCCRFIDGDTGAGGRWTMTFFSNFRWRLFA